VQGIESWLPHPVLEFLQKHSLALLIKGSCSGCTGSFCCLTSIVCHFLLIFKLALIWSPHILFQCIAVDIRFLLTLFQEWAGNGVLALRLGSHITQHALLSMLKFCWWNWKYDIQNYFSCLQCHVYCYMNFSVSPCIFQFNNWQTPTYALHIQQCISLEWWFQC